MDWSASALTSAAMADVSVFAFSVEKVLEGADDASFLTICTAGDGAVFTAGVSTTAAGAGTEAGAGRGASGVDEPPMLREMVGAGRGASVCSWRSKGTGGGCGGALSATKPLPGTNENAPGLSLLMVEGRKDDQRDQQSLSYIYGHTQLIKVQSTSDIDKHLSRLALQDLSRARIQQAGQV